jgi:subtilisin family serine protease
LIYAVRVLNCAGSGAYSQVIAGVDWVRTHHIHPAVASMSLGGPAYTSLDTAINNLIAHGVLVVVAAGNSNANAAHTPPPAFPMP